MHHVHGDDSKGTKRYATTTQAAINLIKAYLGAGVLGMPFAFSKSGLLGGGLVLFIVSFIATHCMLILVRLKHYLLAKGHKVETYGDIAEMAAGQFGLSVVNFLILFTQFGFCCVYVVFIGQNIASFIEGSDWRVISALFLPLWIIFAWMRNLSEVARVSGVSNILMYFGILVIIAASCAKIADRIDDKNASFDFAPGIIWSGFPLIFGIAVYQFEGIGVVMPVEATYKHPQHFSRLVMMCLALATVQSCVFGVINYVGYGPGTDSIITKNLEEFAQNSIVWGYLSVITKLCFIVAIGLTYPIQMFVVTDLVEDRFEYFKVQSGASRDDLVVRQNVFRAILASLTVLVAVTVPNFGVLAGLVGALGSAALQFICPAWFALKLYNNTSIGYRALLVLYILFGACGAVFSTFHIMYDIFYGE